MRIGMAKNDITPRVGVELCGFGPFVLRRSTFVRDRLWARAMAIEVGGRRAVLITCDLVAVTLATTQRVREILATKGVEPDAVMIACSHTHSGPAPTAYIGWGQPDAPYLETLPSRIAKAALQALERLEPATIAHARVPCEGIGQNREYDRDSLPLDEVLRDDWRPNKPELTDTVCDVFRVEAGGRVKGFISYFGCHPVVCCRETRAIHGDYCGVATNLIERDHPGSVGLFLQGAQGDVNSCVVHKPEQESLLALDVIAGRYANSLRAGLAQAKPMAVEELRWARRGVAFTRKAWSAEKLRSMLAEKEAIVRNLDATDEQAPGVSNLRMEVVYLLGLRQMVERLDRGLPLTEPIEMHGLRLGPVAILGSPFETFQAIKIDALARTRSPMPLVTSFVNDTTGYATDRTAAARGGYAADMVPLIFGTLPYAQVHDELVGALAELDAALA